jgi:hypothetical protein
MLGNGGGVETLHCEDDLGTVKDELLEKLDINHIPEESIGLDGERAYA